MSNTTKCICNKYKRTDRISSHILKEHYTSILTEYNIKEIQSSIKHNKGYVQLKITDSTKKYENIRVFVSFGYNCGWMTFENAVKANDKITKDQLNKHINVCEKLIKEYQKTNTITDDNTSNDTSNDTYNEELSNKLKALQKKYNRLEKELKSATEEPITEHNQHYIYMKLITKCFNIDEEKLDTFISNFNYITEKYNDNDTKFEEAIKNFNINSNYSDQDE